MILYKPGGGSRPTYWHQDYPNQLRSEDGLVFWSPLRVVTPALGPVEFCVGSHHDGPRRVRMFDPRHPEKTGSYAMIIDGEEKIVAGYPREAPLSEPGDLVIIDFLTIHGSSPNHAEVPRWTMQMRYFNFADPVGIDLGWCGSFAAGKQLRDVLPHLVVDESEMEAN